MKIIILYYLKRFRMSDPICPPPTVDYTLIEKQKFLDHFGKPIFTSGIRHRGGQSELPEQVTVSYGMVL